MFAESEHGHAHHQPTGIRWLDMIVAVSAIFISFVSLAVSIEHGKIMQRMAKENEKMVAGSTMPFLTFSGSELDPVSFRPRLRLILKNGGVGPARVDWFELRYKGVPYSTDGALLLACCSADMPKEDRLPNVVYSNISGMMIPQRESVDIIDLQPGVSAGLRSALDNSRQYITARACYCSVLDECWEANFGNDIASGSRVQVEKCNMPPLKELW